MTNQELIAILPEPKCPSCKVGVLRPNCMWELGSDCPRHEVRADWIIKCKRIVWESKRAESGDIPLVGSCAFNQRDFLKT